MKAEVQAESKARNWDALQLDFVIAGMDGCGTTSMHRNLDPWPCWQLLHLPTQTIWLAENSGTDKKMDTSIGVHKDSGGGGW